MQSVPAIAFDYRPSRCVLLAVACMGGLAVAAVVVSGLGAWLKPALVLAVVVYAATAVRRLLSPPFTHVTWHSAGHWRLRAADGAEQVGELRHAVVLGALIVLTLRARSRKAVVLLILPDVCDAETRRQLRVRLSRATAVGAA